MTSGIADAGLAKVGLLLIDFAFDGEAVGNCVVRLRLNVIRVRVVGPSGDEEDVSNVFICLCKGERIAASFLALEAAVRRDAVEERVLVLVVS